ncbi:MAG: acyltransferase family protein [Cardiobacteriaceae bacterium]|nr:acyltransferase family protein [Cardiobacteriaceae bacterium]
MATLFLWELAINTATTSNIRYFHGLDELRAGLMLIGVFWHAAAVLSPFAAFVYASPYHRSMPLYATIYPEHLFRMEAFFLVSGFLSQMTLARKNKQIFWKARLKRVLLPLLIGCLGVNFLLQVFGSIFMEYQWSHYDLWRWIMHGWFLICLMVFATIDMCLPRGLFARITYLPCLLVFVIGSVGYTALLYWNEISWHLGGNFSTLYNFFILHSVQYYPFYFFGSVLFYHQGILDRVNRNTMILLGILGSLTLPLIYINGLHFYEIFPAGTMGILLQRLNQMLSSGCIAFLLFVYFFRVQRQANHVIRYLINSAIVIYLVHHPLVIILGWTLDDPNLSNTQYYLLLLILTFTLSYLCYEGVRRVGILRIAFGLKPIKS